ncbi:FG-GAP repeat protein [Candidatus Cyanaurora vandensis]|uniref:FG-GAP repeat protein n=1 Tax=Candidatus Cyanaurora vandensis TaxID=2714958 RepID=UPI00257F77CE|nr:FG-GAP repeat protein [Candidatus Cyanaurora vandensis]
MTLTPTFNPASRPDPLPWLATFLLLALLWVAQALVNAPQSSPRIQDPGLAQAVYRAVDQSRYLAYRDTPQSQIMANPAQGFQTRFTDQGIRVMGDDWTWGLEVESYGYGSQETLPTAAAQAQENRVSYQRGPVTEWYINTDQGLEQGFTLSRRPQGTATGPLHLTMALVGDLQPTGDTRGLTFQTRTGQSVLAYRKLYVHDARGQTLPAEMVLTGQRLALVVADQNAVYPVTIDPVVTSVNKLVPFGGFDFNQYAYTVDIDGLTAVVGAPYDLRSVNTAYKLPTYVFVFNRRQGVWTQQARLSGSDSRPLDFFGSALALNGNTLAVGSYGVNNRTGAVYVFERTQDTAGVVTWTQKAQIFAADRAEFDRFGYTVALDDNTLAVGSYRSDPKGSFSGSAYVFVRNQGVWSQQAKLIPTDGYQYDYFGYAISLRRDTILVGAYPANGYQGKVYVFARSGATWSEQAILTASDGLPNDAFGYSVALSGETAVVGAYTATGYKGKVYVFVRSGTTWSEQAILTASDGLSTEAGGDEFGISVAINVNTLVVGAHGAGGKVGAAYLFKRDGTTWTEQSKLLPGDIRYDTLTGVPLTMGFGYAVDIDSNNNVLVGSPGYNLYQLVGWAYLF